MQIEISTRHGELLPWLLPPRLSRLTWIDFRDTHGDEERYAYRLAQLLADLRRLAAAGIVTLEPVVAAVEAGASPEWAAVFLGRDETRQRAGTGRTGQGDPFR